jgi:hypothetical protein
MIRPTAHGMRCLASRRPVVVGLGLPAALVELPQLSGLALDNETLRIGSGRLRG